MKNLFFTILTALTFMAFNPAPKETKQATDATTDWVPICTGTDPVTNETIKLMANSRTGVKMLVKADAQGNQSPDVVTTTMTQQQFKDYCDQKGLRTNC